MSPELKNGLIPTGFVLLWSTRLYWCAPRDASCRAPDISDPALHSGYCLAGPVCLGAAPFLGLGLKMSFHAGVAGFLVHAVYLGGVFIAIDLGLSAGLTALIVGVATSAHGSAIGPDAGTGIDRKTMVGDRLRPVGVGVSLRLSGKNRHRYRLKFTGIKLGRGRPVRDHLGHALSTEILSTNDPDNGLLHTIRCLWTDHRYWGR